MPRRFTLIETIIILTILAILTTIILSRITGHTHLHGEAQARQIILEAFREATLRARTHQNTQHLSFSPSPEGKQLLILLEAAASPHNPASGFDSSPREWKLPMTMELHSQPQFTFYSNGEAGGKKLYLTFEDSSSQILLQVDRLNSQALISHATP